MHDVGVGIGIGIVIAYGDMLYSCLFEYVVLSFMCDWLFLYYFVFPNQIILLRPQIMLAQIVLGQLCYIDSTNVREQLRRTSAHLFEVACFDSEESFWSG